MSRRTLSHDEIVKTLSTINEDDSEGDDVLCDESEDEYIPNSPYSSSESENELIDTEPANTISDEVQSLPLANVATSANVVGEYQ